MTRRNRTRRNRTILPLIFAIALLPVAGCKKKQAAQPAPPAPPAAAPSPTAELSATPSVISAGDQVTLKWQTTNASSVSIDNGVGTVATSGVQTVTPNATTTYHLTATGDGGTADATATVTVNAPPAVSVAPNNTMSAQQEFDANVQPIFFDYDTSDLRPDAQATLQKDASWLNQHTDVKVVIGGYCDERGSDEYNLALGQHRADATKSALTTMGIAADRVSVISYGKEKPFCSESNEQCWQLNRRAGFAMAQ